MSDNKYEYLDDEYGDFPSSEKIVRGGKREREQGSLTNLFVYGMNRRSGAKKQLERYNRRMQKYNSEEY